MKKVYLLFAIFLLILGVGCPDSSSSGNNIPQEAPDWAIGSWGWNNDGDQSEPRYIYITKNSFKQDLDENEFVFGVPKRFEVMIEGVNTVYYLRYTVTKCTDSVFEISTANSDKENGEYHDNGPHFRVNKKSDGKLTYQHWDLESESGLSEEYTLVGAM